MGEFVVATERAQNVRGFERREVQAEPDETAMSFIAIMRLSPSMKAKLTFRLWGERRSQSPFR